MNMEGDNLGKAISTVGRFNIFVDCEYRITQVKEFGGMSGLVFDEFAVICAPRPMGGKTMNQHLNMAILHLKSPVKDP